MKISQHPKPFIKLPKPPRRLTDKKGHYITKAEEKMTILKEKIATSQRSNTYTEHLKRELFNLKFKRYGV